MSLKHSSKLDQSVWHSLLERHKSHAVNYGETQFYDAKHGPFVAVLAVKKSLNAIT